MFTLTESPRRIARNQHESMVGEDISTVFELGDQAGVYAVVNGKVVPSISNLPLRYNINGAWEAEGDVVFTEELRSADFYAYFPYDAEAVFNPSAADPFAEMTAAFATSSDQSTLRKQKASDLMTTPATKLTAYNTIDLHLSHRFALALVELPNASYVFTNPGLDLYVRSSSDSATFEVDGKHVLPYFDEQTQTYRLLVSTGSAEQLIVRFIGNTGSKTATISNLAQIPAGQYAKYVVDGGVQFTTATLQVGDYFCSDGSIISKDSTDRITASRSSIIGVVWQIGTTPAIQTDYPACKHALVLALDEGKGKWSSKGSTSSDENNAGWKTWWTDYGLAALSTTSAASIDLTELLPTGYEYTAAWLALDTALTLGGFRVPVKDGFQTYYDTYSAAHPLPGVTTSWFVPSLREWLNIKSAETAVAASLAAIEATPFSWDGTGTDKIYYWSCNIRSSVAMWTYTGAPLDASTATLFHADTKDSRYYRFIFAF